MAIHTLAGLVALISTFASLETIERSDLFVFLPLLLVLLVNALICIRVYKNNALMLRFAVWFYAIQIVSIDLEKVTLQLSTGIQFTLSWPIGDGSISINFALVVICIILVAAQASIKQQS